MNTHYEDQRKTFCSEGTREHILAELLVWATEPSDGFHGCLITGQPGAGKSTLAATLAQHLKEANILCAQYFICRCHPGTTDPHKLFPTIAVQLAEWSKLARHVIAEAVDTVHADHLGSEQVKSLLLQPLQEMTKGSRMAVIIIDALDELDLELGRADENVSTLLSILVAELPMNVKIVITARPEASVTAQPGIHGQTLQHICKCVELSTKESVDEVRKFIHQRMKEITPKRPEWRDWPTNQQLKMLSDKADGLFHYAVTATTWIASQIRTRGAACQQLSFFDEVSNLGVASLDALYSFILTQWSEETNKALDHRFCQVVGYLIVLYTAPSIANIYFLLGIPETDFDLNNFFLQMRSLLLPGLDDVTDDTIPLMHKSFRDYITSERCANQFHIKMEDAHLMTAKDCLHSIIGGRGTMMQYPNEKWPDHLHSAMTSKGSWSSDTELTGLLEHMSNPQVFSRWIPRVSLSHAAEQLSYSRQRMMELSGDTKGGQIDVCVDYQCGNIILKVYRSLRWSI